MTRANATIGGSRSRVHEPELVMLDMKNTAAGPGWAPWEVIAAAGLGAAFVVGSVTWAGAALAAVVTGSRLDADLAMAVRAALKLPSNLGDPRVAWPPDVAEDLPGPWLYWSSTALVAAVAIGVVVVGLRVRRHFGTGRKRLGVDVRARFAIRRELRSLLIRRPAPGRFAIGRWGRWLVATENRRHAAPLGRVARLLRVDRRGDITSVAIVGPSRSGKTAECAIPGVLDWDGPAILLSVKRDLLDATIRRRRCLGKVRVFDPAGIVTSSEDTDGAVTIEPSEMGRWSPLRNAHTPSGAKKAGAALASWTPKAGIEDGKFWESSGKILFTGLLGAAALDPDQPSMSTVARWVFTQDMPRPGKPSEVKALLATAAQSNDPATVEAADAAALHLGAIWSKDDKLVSSVYATAQTVADPYLDPTVQASTSLSGAGAEWIDLAWLLDTTDSRSNTLYLVVPLDEYERLGPVLGGLLSDLKAQAYEWDVRGRRFPKALLMLIDEAGNMPLAWLPQVASTCAGIGIQLVTIWQSLAQIEDAYGRQANSVITNHATKLFFPAASDDSTLGYQTRIAGERRWSAARGAWPVRPVVDRCPGPNRSRRSCRTTSLDSRRSDKR